MLQLLLMKSFMGKIFLWISMFLLVQIYGCRCCMEEERRGLLDFKAFLTLNDENADGLLPSWIDDEQTSECCSWERIECNPTTGRVTKLSLNNIRQLPLEDAVIPWQLDYTNDKFWFIDASMFLPFQELHTLNLSANSFDGWKENEGFARLSTLKNLEILDISGNEFNVSIIQSLGALTSLKTLILSKMSWDGPIPIKELAALKTLEMLDLSYNNLSKSEAIQGFEKLSIFENLKILYLNDNWLDNSILPSLGMLKSLESLSLNSNRLVGSFSTHGTENLWRLKKLETLELDNNMLNKSAIQQLSALQSLKNLILSNNHLGGIFPAQELSMLMNLVTLDLRNNELRGSLNIQDSKILVKLGKLEKLDLGGNSLDKEILKVLGALPSLKSLSVAYNSMEGQLSHNELAPLKNLEILVLRGNQFNGTLPIQDMETFSHLEMIDMSLNDFTGSIPPSIGILASLKSLSLSNNHLSGSLPIQGFCALKNLEELDLSVNSFEGSLPSCLNNLTSLRFLDLSQNLFTGNISPSLMASLTCLQYMDLSDNRFMGSFLFSSLANLSKLEVVSIAKNNANLEVETEYPNWVPTFQLKVLALSGCNLNKLSGHIPGFLWHQSKLRFVDLSHNKLTGRFPHWLLVNNTGLAFLHLKNNSLMGQVQLTRYPSMNLYWMDISYNKFDGQLQQNVGDMLPHLTHLIASNNMFRGKIPPSVGKMSNLQSLDLSSNNLSGEVPRQLTSGCIQLTVLRLSDNRLHGPIFSRHFNLTRLMLLYLDNNQFTGSLSNVISRLSLLQLLDVSNNHMSGEIPLWIGILTELGTLALGNNSFKGHLPSKLPSLEFLDFSHNNLSGSLPSLSKLQNLEHLYLQGNRFTGSIPTDFLNSSSLLTLDISYNSLSGSIPKSVTTLTNLRILLLRGNYLSGSIPNQLCKLTQISLVDLSNNYLSGSIPSCLADAQFGEIRRNGNVYTQFSPYDDGEDIYRYVGHLEKILGVNFPVDYNEIEVEFVTKNRHSSYKGGIINFVSGLDLSCNNLTGEIPPALGKLGGIRAMNLSHNCLTGSVPSSFSNMIQLESLDLSYNNLSGEIPSALVDLHFLAVFTVAHNNLSGRVPEKAQFSTFDDKSYDGNPFLCGSLLKRKCNIVAVLPHTPLKPSDGETETKWYDVDPVIFSASCVASYVIILLGFGTVLYINPYWRRRWFNLIEEFIYTCYYFAIDTVHKVSACLCN